MLEERDGFVFIVTYGRSGSTVLQTVLQSIDGYFIRGENYNTLYGIYDAYQRASASREKHGDAKRLPENPWYGADEIRAVQFSNAMCDAFVNHVLQPPADARVIGFKEIRFHEVGDEAFEPFLNFIANRFPGTKFIFNTRGWEAVSKSSWWASCEPETVRGIVENCDRLYADYAAKYPAICHQMKYEDFKGNPSAFKPLFDFLGEHFDEAKVAEVINQDLVHAAKAPPKDHNLF